MLNIKQWMKKVTEWINDHENPRWDYVGNVGSTLFNGTWIAPDNGMVVLNANCSTSSTSNAAYWYVSDSTLNIALANLFWINGNGTWRSASFPVIKGHAYSSSAKARIATANAYFFKLVVGGST